MKRAHHQYLAGGFKQILFSISYMACHPSRWRSPSFFKMVIAPPTSTMEVSRPWGSPNGRTIGRTTCDPPRFEVSNCVLLGQWGSVQHLPPGFAWENHGLVTTQRGYLTTETMAIGKNMTDGFGLIRLGLPGLGKCIRTFLCDVCIIYIYHKNDPYV